MRSTLEKIDIAIIFGAIVFFYSTPWLGFWFAYGFLFRRVFCCVGWWTAMSLVLQEQDGYTALMSAVHRGFTDCVRLLLDAGVAKDAQKNVRMIHHCMCISPRVCIASMQFLMDAMCLYIPQCLVFIVSCFALQYRGCWENMRELLFMLFACVCWRSLLCAFASYVSSILVGRCWRLGGWSCLICAKRRPGPRRLC